MRLLDSVTKEKIKLDKKILVFIYAGLRFMMMHI